VKDYLNKIVWTNHSIQPIERGFESTTSYAHKLAQGNLLSQTT